MKNCSCRQRATQHVANIFTIKHHNLEGEGGGGVSGNYSASPCLCVSLLCKVTIGALNFERLTNNCSEHQHDQINLSYKNCHKKLLMSTRIKLTYDDHH